MPPDTELLEPYTQLVPVRLEGRDFTVPDNNTVLRVLQYLDFDLDPCRLCWNGDCENCHVVMREPDGGEREVRGCEQTVFAGMCIERIPGGARWPPR